MLMVLCRKIDSVRYEEHSDANKAACGFTNVVLVYSSLIVLPCLSTQLKYLQTLEIAEVTMQQKVSQLEDENGAGVMGPLGAPAGGGTV